MSDPASNQQTTTPQKRASSNRSMVGTIIGAALAFGGWTVFGIDGFAPRLGVAVCAFAIGHGIVALVRRASGGAA